MPTRRDGDQGAPVPATPPSGPPSAVPAWSTTQAAPPASPTGDWPPPAPLPGAPAPWPPPAHPPSAPPPPWPQPPPGRPPATRPAAAFWLIMGALGFAVGQIMAAIFLAVAGAVAGESSQLGRYATMAAPPEWYIGTSLVGLWVGFFLGPWVASKARGTGRLLADLGIRFRPIDLCGILIGVGAQYALAALYLPFITHLHLHNFTAPTQKLVGASHGWGYAVIAVLTVCGAPFFEEVLFRGLGLRAFVRLFVPAGVAAPRRRAVGVVAAVVADGIVFGLAHWELYQFAGLAVFGMVLAWASYKTGRQGMNMVAHASFNLVAVLAVLGASGGVFR